MKKLLPLFYLLTIISFLNCSNKEDRERMDLQSNLKIYFSSKIDSSSTLDSFNFIKLDTFTEANRLTFQNNKLLDILDRVIDLSKNNNKLINEKINQMNLYGMIGSSSLVTMQKEEIAQCLEKSKNMQFEMDTLLKISNQIEEKAKHADSIKTVGYNAKCFYQIRLKDKSVERDTAYILLNANKDITKPKDFLQLPYTVDFDKLQ